MSEIATTGIVSTNPNDLTYTPEDLMSRDLIDMFGNTITIHHIGKLNFKCPPSANDYIYKYRITKQIGNKQEFTREIYSGIDLNFIDEDEDYAYAVANTILSSNNIDFAKADNYLGELAMPPKGLEDGKEKFEPGFYTYKIPNSKYALVFDGTKIEAIRAYNQQLEKQNSDKEDSER